jgi:hypothetical protein
LITLALRFKTCLATEILFLWFDFFDRPETVATVSVPLMLSIELLLAAAAALSAPVLSQTIPFYWQDTNQEFLSAYRDKGKMEQTGRTGVAAMHATLIR